MGFQRKSLTLFRFSQDLQLVDKHIPPAVLSVLNRKAPISVIKCSVTDLGRGLQAFDPVHAAVDYAEIHVSHFTSLHGGYLCAAKNLLAYIKTIATSRSGISVRSILKFSRNGMRPDLF